MRNTRCAARSTPRTSVRYSAIDLVTKGVVGFFVLMSHEVDPRSSSSAPRQRRSRGVDAPSLQALCKSYSGYASVDQLSQAETRYGTIEHPVL